MILQQTKGAELSFDEKEQVMTSRFFGFMSSDEFRAFSLKTLELLKQKLASYQNILFLIDLREGKVIKKEDTDWLAQMWNPKAQKSGLTHMAFIFPSSVFAQMSIDNYEAQKVDEDAISIERFADEASALQWYRSEVSVA